MAAMRDKVARIWKEDGPITLAKKAVRFGYDILIRPLLPKRIISYNSVLVRASRVGDSLVPWQMSDIPGYESALIEGIQQYVETGDTVVVVGGGWGVSTVQAARQAGTDGLIMTFEGSAESVEHVEDTIRLNDVDDRVSVRHAIVAQAISLRGEDDDADVVSPTDLPACDILVLDCEGAEVDILEEMEVRPRAVLVETHGMFDAPKTTVRDKLDTAGYKITESKIAEDRLPRLCAENGIYVLYSIRC